MSDVTNHIVLRRCIFERSVRSSYYSAFPESPKLPLRDLQALSARARLNECEPRDHSRRTEAPSCNTRELFCRSAVVLGRPLRTVPWQIRNGATPTHNASIGKQRRVFDGGDRGRPRSDFEWSQFGRLTLRFWLPILRHLPCRA